MTKYTLVFCFLMGSLLYSCQDDQTATQTIEHVEAAKAEVQEQPSEVLVENAVEKIEETVKESPKLAETKPQVGQKAAKVKEKKEPKKAAKLDFSNKTYEFGTKNEGDIIKHDFEFINTGSEPLLITNATSTCGCTVPEWPKEPIEPGGRGVIKATFDTKGKLGTQKKVISITANTYPRTTEVALLGFVGTEAVEVPKDSLKKN